MQEVKADSSHEAVMGKDLQTAEIANLLEPKRGLHGHQAQWDRHEKPGNRNCNCRVEFST